MDEFLKKIKEGVNSRKPAKPEILNKCFLTDLEDLSNYMSKTPANNEYFINVQNKINNILTHKYDGIVIYDYYCKTSTVGVFDLVFMFTQENKKGNKDIEGNKDISYEWIYRLNPDLSYTNIFNSSSEDLKIKYQDIPMPWFRVSE